ncbi:uncharacterized protein LOC135479651 [Liolophura sinensis]|uniref:uncharacterized protein LOC135479651 n=1 Tax=Liolophura sinensis TaxID=3198878 RepID=UPI003158D241
MFHTKGVSTSLIMHVYRHPKLEVYLLVVCTIAKYSVARAIPEVEVDIRHAQRFLNLKSDVCHPETFSHTPNYICCSGRILPVDHPKLKCLHGKPFKRTRTKIKCGPKAQLLSKYGKKYGCCKDQRYKRSHLLCHRGNTYKPLKIPCLPGFQPSDILLSESREPTYTCQPCPTGLFSAYFGMEKCLTCTSCEHVITECLPDRDSECKDNFEYEVRNLCQGKKCSTWKGKRRKMGYAKNLKRPLKVDVESVLTSSREATSNLWTNSASIRPSPLAASTATPPQSARCCDFNATRLKPYEENSTLSNGIDLDEKESLRHTRLLYFVPIVVIVLVLAFSVILLLVFGLFRKGSKRYSKPPEINEAADTAAANNDAYCALLQEDASCCHILPDDPVSNTNCLVSMSYSTASVQQHSQAPLIRATQGHRRCHSEPFATKGPPISHPYANVSESEACQKRWPDVMDLAFPRCSNKPENASLSNWSKTFHSLPSLLNVMKGSCRLASVDNAISEPLEFWKFLPSLIKQFEKSVSYCDMNATDCLVRDQFTQTSIKKTNRRNILGGEWDRGASFDHNGGSLPKAGSAVNLTVPPGAVDAGMAVKIHGKVFTNLDRFVQLFKLRQGEKFVSPVVEFVENQRFQFHRHLVIMIPVSQYDLDDSTFRVLCIPGDGDMSVTSVPRHTRRHPPSHEAEPDVYYDVIEEGFVHVYTKHFTAFACSSCSRDKIYLEGVVMSRTRTLGDSLIEVTIRLFICDKLHLIKDFLTELEENQRKFEFQTVDAKTIQLHETVDKNDELCTNLELSDRSQGKWRPRTRNGGRSIFDNSKKTISNVLSCETPSDLPEIAGEWTYESESEPSFIECFLDVEHLSLTVKNAVVMRTTYDIVISLGPATPNLSPTSCQKNSEITFINSLASDLDIREARRFAREMGVPDTKTELVFNDNSGDGFECKYRVVLSCFRQLGPKVFRQKLPEVLTIIGRLDMVQTFSHCHFSPKDDPSSSQSHRVNTKLETDV